MNRTLNHTNFSFRILLSIYRFNGCQFFKCINERYIYQYLKNNYDLRVQLKIKI